MDNPSVNWVVKNDKKRERRIKELSRFSFKTALKRDGVYISDDERCIALCYRYNFKKETISDYLNQARLASRAIGLSKIPEVLKRESYIKKLRPKDGNFFYFWFLGALPEGRGQGGAKEISDRIFKEADEDSLPIYLETSVLKNKRVYERFGFEIYHEWEVKSQGITLWFMRRNPKSIS